MYYWSEQETNAELLAAIRKHFTSNSARTAYDVPLSELWEQPQVTDEKCIVIPMPGTTATEIDYEDKGVSTQVRRRADGTSIDCLLLASGRVALPGSAIDIAQSSDFGRILVLWVFNDKLTLSEYRFDEQLYEDLWAASLVAQSFHPIEWDEDEPDGLEVIEYLEYVAPVKVPAQQSRLQVIQKDPQVSADR
ncbi:hypothetical protein [Trinickia mobilis]|uniref:hypothetical protein n=1 Tax=Trinickia mobilis TaxID=2816356 RepID=UPI001A8E4192|nr:hypothetical protein [Trinickia mobilis]